MGIFGKKKLPEAAPAGMTQEEKDAWKAQRVREQRDFKERWDQKHNVVAHHDEPDWPRKVPSKKAFRKHTRRARRMYEEANRPQ